MSAYNGGGGVPSLNGLGGGQSHHHSQQNHLHHHLLDNLGTTTTSSTNSNNTSSSIGGGVPDFRNIWENLSEGGPGSGADTDASSLIWTLPSQQSQQSQHSSRNSVSYSPDDFIFQR